MFFKTLKKSRNEKPRHALRSDLDEILEIENQTSPYPWGRQEFESSLRDRYTIGIVIEHQGIIAGFLFYHITNNELHIFKFAVCNWLQRKGLASALIESMIKKMQDQKRSKICFYIRETALKAQLLLCKLEFKATGVFREYFLENDEDAYVMELWNDSAEIFVS